MSIYLDTANQQTVVVCDKCKAREVTTVMDGVVPHGWLTGQLWLDISLSQIKQIPLCFCQSCRDRMLEVEPQTVTVSDLGGTA